MPAGARLGAVLCLLACGACAGPQAVSDEAPASGPSAKLAVYHINQMSSYFMLKSLSYTLDGHEVFDRADQQGNLSSQLSILVLADRVPSGNHKIAVEVSYTGRDGYRFRVKSGKSFAVEPGRATVVKVVGLEQPAAKPGIRYDIDVQDP